MVLNDTSQNCTFKTESPGCALKKYLLLSCTALANAPRIKVLHVAPRLDQGLGCNHGMAHRNEQRLARFCG